MRNRNNLGSDDIKKLVLRIAIPSMLAQFVSVLYSIVDRMYIGHIPEVGAMALGGVGVCGPIVTMVGSFALWVGIGGAPLMSRCCGEKNEKEAEKIVANCFMLLCIVSVVLTMSLIFVKTPMLKLFGAGDEILPYAESYFTVYLSGTIFALLSIGMNQFIVAQGFAKYGMASVVIGAIVNIVLDPIFIFGFNMGVKGAALATVISQLVSCIFVLKFLFGKGATIRITFKGYSYRIISKVIIIGLTPFLIIAADNLMMITLNMVLQSYGGLEKGSMLITCSTIAQSFMLIVTMPLGGITGGTQTILAYNYGAGKPERVVEAQKDIFKLSILYTSILFIVARFFSPAFVKLFTTDALVASQAVASIKMFTIAIIPLGIQYAIVDGFTGLGCVKMALPLSFFRKLVFFVALLTLPLLIPIEQVFYAEAVSDIIPPIVSVIAYKLTINKILYKEKLIPKKVEE